MSDQVRRLEVRDVRIIEIPGKTFEVQFDLDWREAFREGEHWSAAWVFIKVNLAETVAAPTNEAAMAGLTSDSDRPPERIAEMQATDEGAPPGHEPALAPTPKPRDPDRAPMHAFRLPHRRMSTAGQQVEITDDFAFLNPATDKQATTITRFGKWRHQTVERDADVHRPAKGVVITPSKDGMGVFIYRDADGRGPLMLDGIRLRTTLACAGQSLKAWVGALEMVRIPDGDFYLGDPAGPSGPTACFFQAGASGDDQSFAITSEDAISVGFRGGSWYTAVTSGRLADRCFGSGLIGYSERSHDTGIRAVRTAPEHEQEPA
jgi:hypothetical protein